LNYLKNHISKWYLMNSMSCKKFDWYEKFALYSAVISCVDNLVEIFLEVHLWHT